MAFDAVLMEIEDLKQQLELAHPQVNDQYDPAEMEHLFSRSYTTEMERAVLQAALRGAALPVVQQTFEGNSVELF